MVRHPQPGSFLFLYCSTLCFFNPLFRAGLWQPVGPPQKQNHVMAGAARTVAEGFATDGVPPYWTERPGLKYMFGKLLGIKLPLAVPYHHLQALRCLGPKAQGAGPRRDQSRICLDVAYD